MTGISLDLKQVDFPALEQKVQVEDPSDLEAADQLDCFYPQLFRLLLA